MTWTLAFGGKNDGTRQIHKIESTETETETDASQCCTTITEIVTNREENRRYETKRIPNKTHNHIPCFELNLFADIRQIQIGVTTHFAHTDSGTKAMINETNKVNLLFDVSGHVAQTRETISSESYNIRYLYIRVDNGVTVGHTNEISSEFFALFWEQISFDLVWFECYEAYACMRWLSLKQVK